LAQFKPAQTTQPCWKTTACGHKTPEKYRQNVSNKKRARLNCIRHLLAQISYEDLTPEPVRLPSRTPDKGYIRAPLNDQTFVPDFYP